MAYRDQLYPWCIVRSAPNVQPTVIARFRRPIDAEAHLKILRQTAPGDALSIIFEKPSTEEIATVVVAEAAVEITEPESPIEQSQPQGLIPPIQSFEIQSFETD